MKYNSNLLTYLCENYRHLKIVSSKGCDFFYFIKSNFIEIQIDLVGEQGLNCKFQGEGLQIHSFTSNLLKEKVNSISNKQFYWYITHVK